jgi:DNA mismatch repair ATPase MutS
MDPNDKSRVVVAVAAGRRHTCGIVEVDLEYPMEIQLCTTSESSASWCDTQNTIARLQPDLILIPLNQSTTALTKQLQESLPSTCEFRFVARKSFNQSSGEEEYIRLSATRTVDRPSYLVCAALKALLESCTNEEDCTFASGCVSFVEISPTGRLLMDQATLENLEIVRNRETGHRQGSLYGMFKPSSGSGSRLLKKTLMSPIVDINTLNGRYDVVELLTEKNGICRKIQQKLKLTNLGNVTLLFVVVVCLFCFVCLFCWLLVVGCLLLGLLVVGVACCWLLVDDDKCSIRCCSYVSPPLPPPPPPPSPQNKFVACWSLSHANNRI